MAFRDVARTHYAIDNDDVNLDQTKPFETFEVAAKCRGADVRLPVHNLLSVMQRRRRSTRIHIYCEA